MATRGSADRLSPEELRAWQGFLQASARINRALDAGLKEAHRLSGNDYDVLIQLGTAPRRRLPMTTLAKQVLMSPSGLSRLVDDLERDGLVARERREDDGRSFNIVLTPTGLTRLKKANRTHLDHVRELFLDRLSDHELRRLANIWDAIEPTPAAPAAPAASGSGGRARSVPKSAGDTADE